MAATFTPVQRPPATAPPAGTAPNGAAWTVDRLMVALAGVAFVGAILFEFGFDVEGWMMAAPGFPGLAFAIVLAFYARPWVYLTAGILLAVMPLMVLFLFGAVENLADPTQGRSYASVLLLVTQLVLGLWGGIHGFVATRKGAAKPARDFFRTNAGLGAAVLVAIVVGAAFSGLASGARVKEMASAAGGYDFAVDASVPLVMEEYAFAPADLAVPLGQIVEIKVENRDSAFHTFTYESGGKTYNHDVPGGATVGFLVKFDEADTIPYWCAPHSSNAPEATEDEEMRGTIVVG